MTRPPPGPLWRPLAAINEMRENLSLAMRGARTKLVIRPDPSRVLFRPFDQPSSERVVKMVARIMAMDERTAKRQAEHLMRDFSNRHNGLKEYLLQRFDRMRSWLISDTVLSEERKLLIGAYFTQEYAFEAAAIFNPSIAPHPDQSGAPQGGLRFILSLRATGEGHISSLVFREGTIDADGRIELDPTSPVATTGEIEPNPSYDKDLFSRKLRELGASNQWTQELLEDLDETFRFDQLEEAIRRRLDRNRFTSALERESADVVRSLADSNYLLSFDHSHPLSERVIFPYAPTELKGIEDARFVAFRDDDGSQIYYATYTAFNGHAMVPQFIETEDFARFRICTLNGPEAVNKGMALFPRKLDGLYAMVSRQDNENLYLMYSDNPHFWYEKKLLMRPTYDWEVVQLGNCGSPIETKEGWLLITHGVGYMRRYSIGAALLDLEDPARVIGRTREPILAPNEREREGYVPNVVYSCGSLVHDGRLILPYALSDQCASFAKFDLDELVEGLKKGG